jgi:uroporphyrinogen decarboxylase
MRQAGRYMSSYQAVRQRVSFMELCRTPEIACEVTMMPIDQLGVDAAILFSDILVPLEPMGVKVWFDGGPQIAPPVRTVADIDKLRADGVADDLGFVYEAVSLIRRELSSRQIPLLGFAGSPWTMASYLIEGGSSRHHHELKRLMYAEPAALHRLLDKLTRVVTAYLTKQVEAGAQAIQVFDTWGSLLPLPLWREFSGAYSKRVIEAVNALGVPTVHFAKGTHLLEACASLGSTVVSVDWTVPLGDVRQLVGPGRGVQGNIDPAVMRAPHAVIEKAVRDCLEAHGPGPGHIVNFGHGITPDATVDAARCLVDAVKSHGPSFGGQL